MEVALFVMLPVGDAVIDICLDRDELRVLFASLMRVKLFAREHGISLRIYFDQENFSRFIADAGMLMDDGTYLEKPSSILREFVSSCSTDVNREHLLDGTCGYYRWDTFTCSVDLNPPLLIKSAYESPVETCILSLSPSAPTNYYMVSLIKDRPFYKGLPELKNIPLFFTVGDCLEWLTSHLNGLFSLMGNSDFIPTSFHWNNQRIFEKAVDGSYWYLDFFHRDNKIHYEVFNHKGDHLGEASKEGLIIEGTLDKTKSIRHILHGN